MRTHIREDGGQKEVIGARCSFDSAEMSGTFTTPAIVRMPIFKGKPTTRRTSCDTPELSGKRDITPQLNGTAVVGASPAGLVVGLVTASIVAAQDKWSFNGTSVIRDPKAFE